jgi:aldehyde reductase
MKLCSEWDVLLTAYGPLGRPGLSQDAVNDPVVMDDPILKQMAAKYNRTVAQILLRFLVTFYSFFILFSVASRVTACAFTHVATCNQLFNLKLFSFSLYSFFFLINKTIQNIPVIPKSSNKTRILENMASLQFDLSPQDVAAIDGLNRNHRLLRDVHLSKHPHYPFHIDY